MTNSGLSVKKNKLYFENCALDDIAQDVGTPFYAYSETIILNRIRRMQLALAGLKQDIKIYYPVKTCPNLHILQIMNRLGCGFDIVSGGELFRCLAAQANSNDIIYSGVGKTQREILEALKAEILLFNIESVEELVTLNQLSAQLGIKTKVSLRINPNINSQSHPYIATGLKENKFGISESEAIEISKKYSEFKNLNFVGLSIHIGSQITRHEPFLKAWNRLIKLLDKIHFKVKFLNLGGGLGISYDSKPIFEIEDYAKLIVKTFKSININLMIEPGRSLVGPAGILVSRLILAKKTKSKQFYVIDAAMNDLIRPALYQAQHSVATLPSKKLAKVDVVGPICESADVFLKNTKLPALKTNDLLIIENTGAYAMSMASQYNSRPRACEILVADDQYKIIRSRETYANLIENELF